MSQATDSALVILVPDVEHLVAQYRAQYDPAAGAGMPAHITINYPFKDHTNRGDALIPVLEDLFTAFPKFRIKLANFAQFPGVLYLQPEPQGPIVDLVNAVSRKFPGSPPYGGKYKTVSPHLTVAHVGQELLEKIRTQIEGEVSASLPVEILVEVVSLMEYSDGAWKKKASFPLA